MSPKDVADKSSMHDLILGQPNRNIAGVVGVVDADQFDGLATGVER